MHSAIQLSSPDQVLSAGRHIMDIINDPGSNATKLGRLLDRIPGMSLRVIRYAEECLGGHRQIQSTTNAITLIGYDRLERLVTGFLQGEYARLASADTEAPHPLEPRPPVDLDDVHLIEAEA